MTEQKALQKPGGYRRAVDRNKGGLCALAMAVDRAGRELAVGKGFKFDDLGELTLPGFGEPVRVYRLSA